jgi:MoxR-like ATPase
MAGNPGITQEKKMIQDFEQFRAVLDTVNGEIHKVIIGQEAAVRQTLIVLLSGQHALIEGVPGLAKTLLARTLAQILGCEFARIQFTPDLMPADITGTSVFNLQTNEFALVKGPIFTSFLLADEINRAPAKTQSALLQAMQEREVTIDRDTHRLLPDFTVFATQNPIESEGTYPLPEAQKDRFMLKIRMGWPEREDELSLLGRMLDNDAPEASLARGVIQPVLGPGELRLLREALRLVTIRPEIVAYMVDLVRRTRTGDDVLAGAGPRATQSLLLASRAHAAVSGRDFVTPDDVREMALPVLDHRIILRPEAEMEGVSVAEALGKILKEIPVPR